MVGQISIFIFIFGLIVGSFLNVAIYRYGTGYNLRGRSQCLMCGRSLAWYELIPVLSFVFQGGKCHACGARVSWQYPLVELVTGLVFWGIYRLAIFSVSAPLWLMVIDAAIWSILIAITVYDLRHKIIPDGWVYSFIALTLIRLAFGNFNWASGLLAGLALFAFFGGLWLVSRGRWMGFGDAKLSLGLGFFLGFHGALSATILAFWFGAAVGIVILVFERLQVSRSEKKIQSSLGREIPFAPFLTLGTGVIYFFNFYVLSFLAF